MNNILISACVAASLILTACGNGKAAVIQPETATDRESSVITTADITMTEAVSAGETSEKISEIQETKLSTERQDTLLTVKLSIGDMEFTAKLFDNDTARELVSRMPMELDMSELHGNEKYYYLSEGLPTDAENPGNIHTGDLMLYGSDCLVLFYEDFHSSFSYTRLGYLEKPAGLSEAVGADSVTVTFEAGDSAG